jgi:hypothetical protein
MGRSLVIEVEGFVATGTSIEDAEAIGHDVEAAMSATVPNCRAVLWSPRAVSKD